MNSQTELAIKEALPDKSFRPHSVFNALRESIERGDYKPGSRLPAERVLAETFGVDRYAIRRALGQLENERLIVRQHGCRPFVRVDLKKGASRASGNALKTIAVVTHNQAVNPAAHVFMHGISTILRSKEAPYRVVYFNTAASAEEIEREAANAIEHEGVAGAIVASESEASLASAWRPIQELGYPVVCYDRCDESFPCDYVGVDNVSGAKEAVEYLIRLGHRRIAHLTYSDSVSSIRERIAGYKAALRDAGIVPEPDWINASLGSYADVAPYADQIMRIADPPTAIFVVNDNFAHELIACLEARGKRVPDDISIIGFDDVDRFSTRPALLTTMQQPFERMGERAAELLLQRISERDGARQAFQHILFQARLIERSTCRALTPQAPPRA